MYDPYFPQRLPKVRSTAITSAAMGSPCTARLASFLGLQCESRATTVNAHLPVLGKGTSTKVTDMASSFTCSLCHDILDRRRPELFDAIAERYPAGIALRMLESLVETHAILIDMGVIQVKDARIIRI